MGKCGQSVRGGGGRCTVEKCVGCGASEGRCVGKCWGDPERGMGVWGEVVRGVGKVGGEL